VGRALSAVLYVEDVLDRRFGFDDEDALVAVAALLGPTMRNMQELADAAQEAAPPRDGTPPLQGAAVTCAATRPTTACSSATTT
jgi:adenylate cyclase